MYFKRNRTPTKHIYYALHLYFSGLSLRAKKSIITALISIYQKKPYIHLELDLAALQATKDVP
jgi:hypothetical protein